MKRFLFALLTLMLFIASPGCNDVQAAERVKPPFEKARTKGISTLNAVQQALKKAHPDLEYISQSQEDYCVRGKINIKENDPYKVKCVYRVTYYYGFNNPLSRTLHSFDNSLRQDGWQPGYHWGKNECNTDPTFQDISSQSKNWGLDGENYASQYDASQPSYCNQGKQLGLRFALTNLETFQNDLQACQKTYIDTKPYSDEDETSSVDACLNPNKRYNTIPGDYNSKHKEFNAHQELFSQTLKSHDYVASIAIEKAYVYKPHLEIPVAGDFFEFLFSDGYHMF